MGYRDGANESLVRAAWEGFSAGLGIGCVYGFLLYVVVPLVVLLLAGALLFMLAGVLALHP